jgi:hypothetical protein
MEMVGLEGLEPGDVGLGSLLGQLNSSAPSRTVPGMRHARADGETEFLVKLLWHRRTKGVATDSLYHTGPNLDSTESTESIC